MAQGEQCDWTEADTAICERAEASGLALNVGTGNPLTLQELKSLAPEFEKIRDTTTVDVFLKDKISSKPFEF